MSAPRSLRRRATCGVSIWARWRSSHVGWHPEYVAPSSGVGTLRCASVRQCPPSAGCVPTTRRRGSASLRGTAYAVARRVPAPWDLQARSSLAPPPTPSRAQHFGAVETVAAKTGAALQSPGFTVLVLGGAILPRGRASRCPAADREAGRLSLRRNRHLKTRGFAGLRQL